MAIEAKRDWLADHNERLAANYAAEVERGEHDEKCEYDVRGCFYLCHCSKRRRESTGLTKAPTEDLYFPPPDCTNCFKPLVHDGESWYCGGCRLTWDSNGAGDSAHFIDDFDDDLAEKAEKWRTANGARLKREAEEAS